MAENFKLSHIIKRSGELQMRDLVREIGGFGNWNFVQKFVSIPGAREPGLLIMITLYVRET